MLLRSASRRNDLVCGAARQFGHMVEFESEGTDAGRGRAYLDDQISNLRFRHLGAHGVPAIPVFARVETEDLTSPAREDGVHFRGRFVRADDFYLMDRLQQHGLALRQAFRDSDTAGGAE